MSAWSDDRPIEVTISDIDISTMELAKLITKVALACLPALLIWMLAYATITGLLAKLFPGL